MSNINNQDKSKLINFFIMAEENISILCINNLQNNVERLSRDSLNELLDYFEYIQETFLIAFNNARKLISFENVPNNPKVFALIIASRLFSISKVAMDITIKGYPLEGIALTRTLFEMNQCTQYLVRHNSLIDAYLLGKLKLDKILQMAKNVNINVGENPFGHFWELASRFTHSSPDLLALQLTTPEINQVTIQLIMTDLERIKDTAYGIMAALFINYFIFRIVSKNDFQEENKLRTRDEYIFNHENLRNFPRLSSFSDQDIEKMYSFFASETSKDL